MPSALVLPQAGQDVFIYNIFLYFFPTTFMLRVYFSPAPECVEVDSWNQAFQTPPCHQDGVVVIVVVVIVVVPALTKGYIGNALLKIPKRNI